MKYLYLLLLACSSTFAQSLDTLFFKNFNDGSITSTFPGNKGEFVLPSSSLLFVTNANTATIDASPALLVDLGALKMKSMMGNGYGQETIFRVEITDIAHDTVIVQYQLKATKVYTNPSTLFISTIRNATIQAFPSGRKYEVTYETPAAILFAGGITPHFGPYVSFPGTNDQTAIVQEKYGTKGKNSFPFTCNSAELVNDQVVLGFPFLPDTKMEDKALKQFLMEEDCKPYENKEACKQFTSFEVKTDNGIDLSKKFLIDNILVLGKNRSISTDLEEHSLNGGAKTILKAYTFLGQEIKDIEQYKGAALLLYSDGTKGKVIR